MITACTARALVAIAALVTWVLLHYLEPQLAMTWSYAHLHRHAALPWIGVALLLAVPPITMVAWQSDAARRPAVPPSWSAVVLGVLLLWAGFAAAGLTHPVSPQGLDPWVFLTFVQDGTGRNGRWYLTLWTLSRLAALLRPVVSTVVLIRCVTTLLVAFAFLALAGSARILGRTRGEVLAITLVAWTALGPLQLGMGYVDVYPVALAVTAAYVWAGLRVITGSMSPAWPVFLVLVGPFWYIGLVQLVPSLGVVVAVAVARREGAWRSIAMGAAAAFALASLAPIAWYGRPFAWGGWWHDASAAAECEHGLSPTSCLLPWSYMLSAVHAEEVVHTLLLVDGVGMAFLLAFGTERVRLSWRQWDPRVVFLACIALPFAAYLFVLDPLFGPYSDWDAFTYGAAVTSLLGGFVFVRWGRRCPHLAGLVLGIGLAAAGVHLLARLNAMHIDFHRHVAESPFHVEVDRR